MTVTKPVPGTHGRSADGRAFRVDKEGMRITDYIAELEVTIDDQHRQITALEDELDDKRARLEQLSSGAPPVALKETDLAGGGTAAAARQRTECDRTVADLKARMERLQQSEAAARQQVAEQQDRRTDELQRTLLEARAANEQAEGSSRRLESELGSTRAALDERDRRIAELEAKLEQLTSDVRMAKAAPPAPPAADLSAAASRAALSRKQEERPAAAPAPAGGTADLAGARQELQGTLQRIQSLIIQRKDLSDAAAKSRSRGITIQLRPLVAQSGSSLDLLRSQVHSLSADTNVPQLRTDLARIEAILQEDIGTLRRLKSL